MRPFQLSMSFAADRARFLADAQCVIAAEGVGPNSFLDLFTGGLFIVERNEKINICSSRWREIIPLMNFGSQEAPPDVCKSIRKGGYTVSTNQRYEEVVLRCARTDFLSKDRWIGEKTIRVLFDLRDSGHAHSQEVWCGDQLAAVTLGVQSGGVYYGLSSYCDRRFSGAGIVAAFELFSRLKKGGFGFFDAIYPSAFSRILGGGLMPSDEVKGARMNVSYQNAEFEDVEALLPRREIADCTRIAKPDLKL